MSQSSHNGNAEKRDSYRTYSYIFLVISIIGFTIFVMNMYTSHKNAVEEFSRVKEENNQIYEYNKQLTLNGDTTTPRKDYVSVDSSKYDTFGVVLVTTLTSGLGGAGYNYFKKKADVLESGILGETMVNDSLNRLTDDYEVLDNVQIHVGDRRAEIDSLVLSKYGIWIIEVKNHKGVIRGNVNNPTWMQDKVSKGGNTYTSNFPNPLRQANRQMGILKEMLSQNGLNTFVNVVVVFPSASSVNVNSDKVFSNMSDLNDSIRKNTKAYFTQEKLNKIKAVLKGEKIEAKNTNTSNTISEKKTTTTSTNYQQTFGEDDLLNQLAAQRAQKQQHVENEQNTQSMIHQMTNDLNESVHQQMFQQQINLHNQIQNQSMMDSFMHQSSIDSMNASMNAANTALHAVDHSINNTMNPF